MKAGWMYETPLSPLNEDRGEGKVLTFSTPPTKRWRGLDLTSVPPVSPVVR